MSSSKEARFVAEFLAAQAQARPSESRRGSQLYSQVVSRDKTVEYRMKSVEAAMYEMKRLLERLSRRGV